MVVILVTLDALPFTLAFSFQVALLQTPLFSRLGVGTLRLANTLMPPIAISTYSVILEYAG